MRVSVRRAAQPANAQAWTRRLVVLFSHGYAMHILPQLLSTSFSCASNQLTVLHFSCHSCCSHVSVFGRVLHRRSRRGLSAALNLGEDVEEHNCTDVHQADYHHGVRRQLHSIGLASEESQRITVGGGLVPLHIGKS